MLINYYTTPNSLLTQSLSQSQTSILIFYSLHKLWTINSPSLFSDNNLTFYITEKIKIIPGQLAQSL